jgi:hypothetical protein
MKRKRSPNFALCAAARRWANVVRPDAKLVRITLIFEEETKPAPPARKGRKRRT